MHTNNGIMPLRFYYITVQGDLYFSTRKALANEVAHFLQISWEHAKLITKNITTNILINCAML